MRGFLTTTQFTPLLLCLAWLEFSATSRAATEFGGIISKATPAIQGPFFDHLQTNGDLRWMRWSGEWLAKRGMDQVSILQFAPASARTKGGRNLPDDLLALYWHCRTNLPVFPGVRQAWEVWNEPDFPFVAENPDRMAAVMKAAWWGIKAGNPSATVLMPSLALPPGRYLDELDANRAGLYTEGYNFHHYGWPHEFLPNLKAHSGAMARMGWDLPLWITEAGHFQMPRELASDATQLARQQACHERMAISAFIAGAAVYLPFILTPYTEEGSDLGMSTPDLDPRPALASYLALTRLLPKTVPLFRIQHRPTKSEMGVVLEESPTNWWTILWSPIRHLDTQFAVRRSQFADRSSQIPITELRTPNSDLRSPIPDLRSDDPTELELVFRFAPAAAWLRLGLEADFSFEDLDEARFSVSSSQNLHLRTAPRPFQIADCDWIKLPGPTSPTSAPRSVGLAPNSTQDGGGRSPVVIQVDYDTSGFEAHKPSLTYRYHRVAPLTATVTLYNFTEQPQPGNLRVVLPKSWTWNLALPGKGEPGFRDEPPARGVAGGLQLLIPPLATTTCRLHLVAPATGEEERKGLSRDRLQAVWTGVAGTCDIHAVWLEPMRPTPDLDLLFPSSGWVNPSRQPNRWQITQGADGEVDLVLQERSRLGLSTSIQYALPASLRLRDHDELVLALTSHAISNRVQFRLTLFTEDLEILRYQESAPVSAAGTVFRARIGDFTRNLWSRIPENKKTDPGRIRCVNLDFGGMSPGDRITIRRFGTTHRPRQEGDWRRKTEGGGEDR